MIGALFFSWYMYYDVDMGERESKIDVFKSVNVTLPANTTIEYGNKVKEFPRNWLRLDVKIVYLDSPWDTHLADFWYNTANETYRLVEKEYI